MERFHEKYCCIVQPNILRIVGFYVRHSAVVTGLVFILSYWISDIVYLHCKCLKIYRYLQFFFSSGTFVQKFQFLVIDQPVTTSKILIPWQSFAGFEMHLSFHFEQNWVSVGLCCYCKMGSKHFWPYLIVFSVKNPLFQ